MMPQLTQEKVDLNYSWHDSAYGEFVKGLLDILEPRHIGPN
jgi:hypothetical protein